MVIKEKISFVKRANLDEVIECFDKNPHFQTRLLSSSLEKGAHP